MASPKHRRPADKAKELARFRRSHHHLVHYEPILNFVNADLTSSNYLRLLLAHDPRERGASDAELLAYARSMYPIGGRPFDPRDALARAREIRAYLRRVLDRMLAGVADPTCDQATGYVDLVLVASERVRSDIGRYQNGKGRPVVEKRERRPYEADANGKTPHVNVNIGGPPSVVDNDLQDLWYHQIVQLVTEHQRPSDRPWHPPFWPLKKSAKCGHYYFQSRPNKTTCSRTCTLAVDHQRRRPARTRPRPTIPPPRARRQTNTARPRH